MEDHPFPFTPQAVIRRLLRGAALSAACVAIGLAAGLLDAFFSVVLSALSSARVAHPFYMIPLLPLAGFLIVWLSRRSGFAPRDPMEETFRAAEKEPHRLPWHTIPYVMAAAWLTHGFGGSAGRVGVAVPMGAVLADHLSRLFPSSRSRQILLISGMAAGFGGLFQAPVAGVFFAMEILSAGRLPKDAFLPALAASWSAYFAAILAGAPRLAAPPMEILPFSPSALLLCAAAGIAFGMTGGSFAWAMGAARHFFQRKWPNPYVRIALAGILAAALSLLCHAGRYSGLSAAMASAAFTGGVIYWYDWIAKFGLTILTRASGFQGGDVMPLLCIGSALGAFLAPYAGFPVPLMSACGAIAVLAGAANLLMAPLCLGMELFGWEAMPFFFTACVIARAVSGSEHLYRLQKEE